MNRRYDGRWLDVDVIAARQRARERARARQARQVRRARLVLAAMVVGVVLTAAALVLL